MECMMSGKLKDAHDPRTCRTVSHFLYLTMNDSQPVKCICGISTLLLMGIHILGVCPTYFVKCSILHIFILFVNCVINGAPISYNNKLNIILLGAMKESLDRMTCVLNMTRSSGL